MINKNPKTITAVLWNDLNTDSDLTNFIEDQNSDIDESGNPTRRIDKSFVADTLEMLNNESDLQGDPEYMPIINGLTQVAKIMQDKRIDLFLL